MRLFLGLPLPPDAAGQLRPLQQRLLRNLPGLRLTPAANLHVTLKFLGEVPDDRVMHVVEAVNGVAVDGSLHLELAGLWPETARPSAVAGVAVHGPGLPSLVRLYESIEVALHAAGYRKEGRAFSPHVTLGRSKPPKRLPDALREHAAQQDPVRVVLSELVLYVSDLSPGGASYTPVARRGLMPA